MRYMKWLSEKLQRAEGVPSAWYSVTMEDFYANHGRSLLSRYQKSPAKLLMSLFPESIWEPWMFESVPKGFWEAKENRKMYLDWLARKLDYGEQKQWYRVNVKDFELNKGIGLMVLYNYSPYIALSSTYDKVEWLPWLFDSVPKGYFDQRENRRVYVDWLVQVSGIPSARGLRMKHFLQHGGGGLLNKFGSSVEKLLADLEMENLPSVSEGGSGKEVENDGKRAANYVPRRYWISMINQRALMDEIGTKIGASLADLSPWYNVTVRELGALGGASILRNYYRSSVYAMLKAVYPEYDWLPWKFKKSTRTAHLEEDILEKAVRFLEKELKMADLKDW